MTDHIKRLLQFSLLLISLSPLAGPAQVNAHRITSDNAPQLIRQGPDAIGGIGDWWISNGTLCAVVSDIDHENEFSGKGGALIDLGYCDRADDHMTWINSLLNGDRRLSIDVQNISMQSDAQRAQITTLSERDGVQLETTFSLQTSDANSLSISKRISVVDAELADINFFSDAWFNYHSLETFLFSSENVSDSRGFTHIDFVTRGLAAIREAPSIADTVVLMSPSTVTNPITYGWQLKSATRESSDEIFSLPAFLLSDEESTVMLIMSDEFYFGNGARIGYLQIPQIPFLSLDSGDVVVIESFIHVGDKSDVASITDHLFEKSSIVTGQTSELNSVLHVHDLSGNPITFARPNAQGEFEFRLPQGFYTLEHRGTTGRSYRQSIDVAEENLDLGALNLPLVSKVQLPRGNAMRLVFKGLQNTTNPDFTDSLTGYEVVEGDHIFRHAQVSQLFLDGTDNDVHLVDLAPGEYKVFATRGPEYSVTQSELIIEPGMVTELNIDVPERVVSTPGYIAVDLHVHAEPGFDNTMGMQQRVKTFVAEQGEVLVSSEHDVPLDMAPVIESMGLTNQLVSIAAVEMTSLLPSENYPYTVGHANFFPVQPKPFEYRKGMIDHENRRLREVLHDFDHQHPNSVAQLNHARASLALSGDLPNDYQDLIDSSAYLDHMGSVGHPYNPQQSLDSYPNNTLIEPDPATGYRDIDFDAMEIINPGGIFHDDRIVALRQDWLSFLAQGFRITGTANSDSHHAGQQVAVPRTMVALENDNIENFDQDEFIAAIKNGKVYGTTGPMLAVSMSNQTSSAMMGETLLGNRATLNVEIISADWIPVDAIKVTINTEVVIETELVDRMELKFDLNFEKDSFVTVEVSGATSQIYETLYPEIKPYAFTNPIYIDADADGQWQAPGL